MCGKLAARPIKQSYTVRVLERVRCLLAARAACASGHLLRRLLDVDAHTLERLQALLGPLAVGARLGELLSSLLRSQAPPEGIPFLYPLNLIQSSYRSTLTITHSREYGRSRAATSWHSRRLLQRGCSVSGNYWCSLSPRAPPRSIERSLVAQRSLLQCTHRLIHAPLIRRLMQRCIPSS